MIIRRKVLRTFTLMIGLVAASLSLNGCAGDLTPYEQNQLWDDYRCNLMPERECRW